MDLFKNKRTPEIRRSLGRGMIGRRQREDDLREFHAEREKQINELRDARAAANKESKEAHDAFLAASDRQLALLRSADGGFSPEQLQLSRALAEEERTHQDRAKAASERAWEAHEKMVEMMKW